MIFVAQYLYWFAIIFHLVGGLCLAIIIIGMLLDRALRWLGFKKEILQWKWDKLKSQRQIEERSNAQR